LGRLHRISRQTERGREIVSSAGGQYAHHNVTVLCGIHQALQSAIAAHRDQHTTSRENRSTHARSHLLRASGQNELAGKRARCKQRLDLV
jgi:hypothetical protein